MKFKNKISIKVCLTKPELFFEMHIIKKLKNWIDE